MLTIIFIFWNQTQINIWKCQILWYRTAAFYICMWNQPWRIINHIYQSCRLRLMSTITNKMNKCYDFCHFQTCTINHADCWNYQKVATKFFGIPNVFSPHVSCGKLRHFYRCYYACFMHKNGLDLLAATPAPLSPEFR